MSCITWSGSLYLCNALRELSELRGACRYGVLVQCEEAAKFAPKNSFAQLQKLLFCLFKYFKKKYELG